MGDNFLRQVIDRPIRENTITDWVVTNIRKLAGDLKIGCSLGCSNHALVEFTVLRNIGQIRSKVRVLNFRLKTNFQLTRETVSTIPWETALMCISLNKVNSGGFFCFPFISFVTRFSYSIS